jgi:hypothetical protein
MFELGRFIIEEMKMRGIKRSELVFRLGYANINKGLRALDLCIKQGDPHPFVVQNLHTALSVDHSVIAKVLEITEQQRLDEQEARARKYFRPHLWIITERERPTSITMALFSGMTEKRVGLPPDINALPFEDQLEIAELVVLKHYAEHKGNWHFFGKIVGYYFFHSFRENVRYDIDGNVEKKETTPFEEPEGYLIIGNKKVSGGLFSFSNNDHSKLELNKSARVENAKSIKTDKIRL